MHRLLLLVLGVWLCLPFAASGRAQTPNTPHQHASAAPIVDGATHPELIPDSVAYRLYFEVISIGANATDEDRKRQRAFTGVIGLEAEDVNILIGILNTFRVRHDALVAEYNLSAQAAADRNEVPDTAAFVQRLDELVQSTRSALKAQMSPRGMIQFDAFVRSEKKRMKVQGGEW